MADTINLTLPGNRAIANWQKSLRRYRPTALWLRHFVLHRVEALVNVSDFPPLRQLDRLVLEAFADVESSHDQDSSSTLRRCLADRLHLDPVLIDRMLAQFQSSGLIQKQGERWRLTDQGQSCVNQGQFPGVLQQRRTFYFEQSPDNGSLRYLSLHRPATSPWKETESWSFDIANLEHCIAESRSWKQKHGFPLEVQSLCKPEGGNAPPTPEEWSRIIVDRPEQALLLLALTEKGELLGWGAQPQGWKLRVDHTAIRLSNWKELFPELEQEPEPEDWEQAWLKWGMDHQLPRKELEECRMQPKGRQLHIAPPSALFGMIRRSQGGILKGELWLAAGQSSTRKLAQVKIVKEIQTAESNEDTSDQD